MLVFQLVGKYEFIRALSHYSNYYSITLFKFCCKKYSIDHLCGDCHCHCICPYWRNTDQYIISHYGDIIMGAIASQITSLTNVYSTVYSDADQRKHQTSVSLAFVGKSPGNDDFPTQMASHAENVSIWWHHHAITQEQCSVARWMLV